MPAVRHAAPTTAGRRAVWFVLHLFVPIAPLWLAATEVKPGAGFVVNLSVALGFVALSVLGLQFALAARWARVSAPFGIDVVLRYHREVALISVTSAFGHPLILFLYSREYRPLLDVLHAPPRAQLAWVSVAALAVLMVTSLWRRALHIPYPVWHITHSVLGVVTVLTALAHAFLVNNYMAEWDMRALWIMYGAAFCWMAVWARLVKPVRLWQRPWRVVELWPEPGNCLTVTLRPAYRHHGQALPFHPGQFAWILTGSTPFNPTYHPFTISSSSETNGRVEFTIRMGGGFTRSLRDLQVGDTVFVDGPHGSFTVDRHPGPGFVFVGTGVGITPFLSMLATMADRGDRRPVWLFLGNRYEAAVVGVRQLRRLTGRVDLTTVHVISRPSRSWRGESGRIAAPLLARHLPDHYRALQFFVCASPPISRSLERTLRLLDVPPDHIHAEHFHMV